MTEEKFTLKGGFSEQIISKILSGELSPGDRLPAERSLAKQYGISRGSVNQGILDLERMGFLRVAPRHGNYVADYLKNMSPEIASAIMSYDSALLDPELFRDLMELRVLIEGECAALAAQRIKQADIDELSRCTNRLFSVGREELSDALFSYHIYIAGLSGNKAYLMLFRSFEKMIRKLIEAHYASSPSEADKVLPIYNELTSAVSHGESACARRLMHDILDYAAGYLDTILRET